MKEPIPCPRMVSTPLMEEPISWLSRMARPIWRMQTALISFASDRVRSIEAERPSHAYQISLLLLLRKKKEKWTWSYSLWKLEKLPEWVF